MGGRAVQICFLHRSLTSVWEVRLLGRGRMGGAGEGRAAELADGGIGGERRRGQFGGGRIDNNGHLRLGKAGRRGWKERRGFRVIDFVNQNQ